MRSGEGVLCHRGSKERDSISQYDGDYGDRHLIQQTPPPELTDHPPTIDVDVVETLLL